MANAGDQKLKILYIMEMFEKETDEHHFLNASDIAERLEELGIAAERKSIYRDIDILVDFGMDIERAPDGRSGYYLASRDFELPELKLLADAVAASKFITDKKSAQLEKKIERLTSRHEARQLQRQVVVSDRVKTENERIYYAIDVIYNCIDNNHRMEFQYSEWTAEKRMELRRGGMFYQVSPEFLLWDHEYYYLVAFDHRAGGIRHYRVDKIVRARETEEERGGAAQRASLNKSDYARKRFGMFAGEPKTVSLCCGRDMAGIMLDRFGTDIFIRPEGEDEIVVRAEIEVSPQFYGWLTGLGSRVRIYAPEDVAEDYRRYLEEILDHYRGGAD